MGKEAMKMQLGTVSEQLASQAKQLHELSQQLSFDDEATPHVIEALTLHFRLQECLQQAMKKKPFEEPPPLFAYAKSN